MITAKGEKDKSYIQSATFDITQEEVQLEKVEEDFSSEVIVAVWATVVIILLLCLFIGWMCAVVDMLL